MKIKISKVLTLLIVGAFLIAACQNQQEKAEMQFVTPALPDVQTSPALKTPTAAALPEKDQNLTTAFTPIESDSHLCDQQPADSIFKTKCEDGALSISQAENRKKVNIFFSRELLFEGDSLSLEIDVISSPAPGLPLDQNQYGIYFVDKNSAYRAVRVSGQYFNFETWSMVEEVSVEDRYNRVFSPFLKPFDQNNRLRLSCTEVNCDLYVNGKFAGSFPDGSADEVTAVGLFATSDWDQTFGQVKFSSFQFTSLPPNLSKNQTYQLADELKADHGTFSGVGLSGAFNDYTQDGFHFSSVVPFSFYAVKTGPSLADSSIEVTVKMEIKPGVSGSQFAGLICRSSQEGMVAAVIRVDGTYTVFRDTSQRPMAVLARKSSKEILPGLSENQLRLDCKSSLINFYINGIKVESLGDTRYGVRFGRAGLYTKSGGAPDPDAIVFSNFSIKEIR